MARIDAHQHFWRIARDDYGWLNQTDHARIYRDYLPADLQPLLAQHGIERTILVQAAPTVAETEFLLDIAASTPFVAGVVGWLDLTASDVTVQVERLREHAKFVGLRPMLQDIDDTAWMLRDDVAHALDTVAALGLRFDALVTPRHLCALSRFLDRHPDLAVMIDHGAKPDIAGGVFDSWANALRDIARRSNAVCKLSGLVTEAGQQWSATALRPFVDVLLETFGPTRLLWGSDWPVLEEVASYDTWFDAAVQLTQQLSAHERASIFGGNAARCYGVAVS